MNETVYSLANLWPEFSRVWEWDVTSAEGLSALFVLVLIVGATLFALISLWNYFRAKSQLRFYRKLLKGLTSDHLLEKQRELVNAALKNNMYGRLWREFDESLVHVPSRSRLYNTLDAAHFFNTHTIARGLTENRLLAAVPGFLTAIGVIGTFAGLQMGLTSLSHNMGDEPKIDELTLGIFGMIGGASIAFMTSVWGVFTSVVFNLFEKVLERNIRGAISSFQNEVDFLYPRITAEQSLSNIEDFSRQSSEKLAELDEKIGHRLQEAMREATTAIRDGMEQSLSSILAPAIEKLVDNAHSGSEKALETLLERFMAGVGTAGVAQKEMMEKAANDVQRASSTMTEGLTGFVTGLEKQIEQMVDQSAKTINSLQENLTQNMDAQQDRDVARQSVLNTQMTSFQGSQDELRQGLGELLDNQKQHHTDLTVEMKALLQGFGEVSAANHNAANMMQQSSAEMKASAVQLGLMSTNIAESSKRLGESIVVAAKNLSEVGDRSEKSLALHQGLIEQLEGVNARIGTTADMMKEASQKAGDGLSAVDMHFKQLGNSLREHVSELESQIAKLLNDYSEKVQSQTVARMSVWNEQTNAFIGSMTDAVRVLNEVVDEMDGKLSSGART